MALILLLVYQLMNRKPKLLEGAVVRMQRIHDSEPHVLCLITGDK